MSAKSSWSLLAVAALLFAFIFYVEHPYRRARNLPPDLHVFPGVAWTNITRVQIQPADQVDLRVEGTNHIWHLTRPVAYPADPVKVETFLYKLSQLTWQGHIASAELQNREVPDEFGLATPQFSIGLEEGKSQRRLLVGKRLAVGNQVYVQVVGADGVYIVDDELLDFMPKDADSWRDRRVAVWSELTFNTIRSKAGNNSFEIQFSPTNFMWRMTKPLEARADNPKLNELLVKLRDLQVTQFVSDDREVDLEKYGLLNPELELTFALGTNDLLAVQFGASPTNNPAEVFARRRGERTIFLVPKEPLAGWRLPYSDFRERHLATLPEKAVDELHIKGEDEFVLRKDSEQHWRVDGQTLVADPGLVQELLARLNLATVEVEKNVVTDYASYGLATPLLTYDLLVKQHSPTNPLRADLDTHLEFGTNGGKVFVRRSDETSVFSMRGDDFSFFPRAIWQLRDRQIWNFDSSNVVNVVIQTNGVSRQMIRNAKGDWVIAQGSGVVNTFSFEEAIHRLGNLKAVSWTARGQTNLARYGFKENGHHISLQVKHDGKLENYDLLFGGMSEFMHPYAAVTVDGEKLIFEFPWPLYYDFVLRDLSISPGSAAGAR